MASLVPTVISPGENLLYQNLIDNSLQHIHVSATIPLPLPSSFLHKRKINASIPLHLHPVFCVLVPLADTVYLLNLALWPHRGTSMP